MSGFNEGRGRGGRGGPRGGRGGGQRRSFGPREEHKVTCSECGKECTVPFKPSGDRPVFCRDCFAKRRKDRY